MIKRDGNFTHECEEFRNVIKYSGTKMMTLTAYAKWRERKAQEDPEKFKPLTESQISCLSSAIGRKYDKLGFTYTEDRDGHLERAYYLVG